ncbi:MAG: fused MFS/spermidine synthase, partial [Sphingomonas sp.]
VDTASPIQGLVFLIVVVLGLCVVGARGAFVVVLAGALVAFGGYRSLMLSLEPGARSRSYFGVYTVLGDPSIRQLKHGTTVHGTELLGSPERERTTTAYYVPGSGVGQAMQAAPALYGDHARIGVVGLGAGTLACYAKPGQQWRFYEIDPAVVRIARDTGQFHFLRDCLPGAKIEIGDARLNLAVEPTASLDLLTLDAFSSDAVPMHLMTREAFDTYGRVLAPRGVLMVHISNKFLDLEPVISAAAMAGGWHSAKLVYFPGAEVEPPRAVSFWVAMSRDPAILAALKARDASWQPLSRYPDFTPWSDDYSTILPLVKAFH